ncbi:hypothetical protein [Microcystis phage Mvi-JY20]|uniref:Uncharacterized protein n=1 Tax=Microcystis phage Mvi-JY20 TaxID=3128146 RepID=A0AAX4QG60_9CAUD
MVNPFTPDKRRNLLYYRNTTSVIASQVFGQFQPKYQGRRPRRDLYLGSKANSEFYLGTQVFRS